jgi:hypothetical protein
MSTKNRIPKVRKKSHTAGETRDEERGLVGMEAINEIRDWAARKAQPWALF